jgi:hypothetical protein
MSNLLTIERAFLSLPQVKQGLKLNEFKTLQRNVENAQKKKFDTTLELSKVVLSAFNWYKSTEGQSLCAEEGISWSAEEFGFKVFGFQKSYFYKLTRAGKLEDQIITNFKLKCTEIESEGQTPNRSLEGLLKYAKELEEVTTGSGQGENDLKQGENNPREARVETRPQVLFNFEFKPQPDAHTPISMDYSVKLTMLSNGQIKVVSPNFTNDDDSMNYAKNVIFFFNKLINNSI